MILKKYFGIVILILLVSSLSYSQGKADRTLYQSSPIAALLNGAMTGSFKVTEITKHGGFGLGTYNGVDGEMIVLDGKVYRVDFKGNVSAPGKSMHTPFVSVTNFHQDTVMLINNSLSMKQLQEYIDKNLKSKNAIYAVKISGRFNYMETRSIEKQTKPYSNLSDVTKNQSVFKFKDIQGTMVGFRMPSYMQGVNLAGYHFHFLSKDKKSGGHILECTSGDVKIEIEELNKYELIIPSTADFYNVELDK